MAKAEVKDPRFRLMIRIGADDIILCAGSPLSRQGFATEYHPLSKSISVAANLREAFTTAELLQSGYSQALLALNTPAMLMPIEEYQATDDVETLYRHTFSLQNSDQLISTVLPSFHAVAVFPVNKDLRMVIDDHFSDVRIQNVMEPVWNHLYERAFTGPRKKLFVYFHDQQLDVFSFAHNHFRFSNTFHTVHTHDAVYFLLYAWKQLGLNNTDDELHLIGTVPDKDRLREQLHRYIAHVYHTTTATEYPQLQEQAAKELPYDMVVHRS